MPDVFVYVSKEDAERLYSYFIQGELIPRLLREATAKALTDLSGPQDVEVRLMKSVAGDNTIKVQILCIASKTKERAHHVDELLYDWAKALAGAWQEAMANSSLQEIAKDFPPEEVGIWPLMPEGQWHTASDFPPVQSS